MISISNKEEVENYLYKSTSPTAKEVVLIQLSNKLSDNVLDMLELQLPKIIDFDFQVLANNDEIIYIKKSDAVIEIYDFNGENSKLLKIDKINKKEYLEYSEEGVTRYEVFCELINKIVDMNDRNPLIFLDAAMIFHEVNYCCPTSEREVLSSDNVALYEFSSYKINNPKRTYRIVHKSSNRIIGTIFFELKKLEENKLDPNFSYIGNVNYRINEEYQGFGYATEALTLLIEQIKCYSDEYAKDLYLSISDDNIPAKKVAIKNGGKIIYDDYIPKDKLPFNVDNSKKTIIYKK